MNVRRVGLLALIPILLATTACGIERRHDRREDRREDRQDNVSQAAPVTPRVQGLLTPAVMRTQNTFTTQAAWPTLT
ncbi:MAG: hypothetical protein KA387_03920 [Rubrivivax sp.]|nr:hypothetical protein [Rubrivivax sp.]